MTNKWNLKPACLWKVICKTNFILKDRFALVYKVNLIDNWLQCSLKGEVRAIPWQLALHLAAEEEEEVDDNKSCSKIFRLCLPRAFQSWLVTNGSVHDCHAWTKEGWEFIAQALTQANSVRCGLPIQPKGNPAHSYQQYWGYIDL